MTFVDKDGSRHTFEVADGDNLLDVAQANDLEMEGACGGSCACSTCHVIVEGDDWFDKMVGFCTFLLPLRFWKMEIVGDHRRRRGDSGIGCARVYLKGGVLQAREGNEMGTVAAQVIETRL